MPRFIYETERDKELRKIRRENAKFISVDEELNRNALPPKSTVVLWLFKFVPYASRAQLLQWADLPSRSRVLMWLYMHGYINGGQVVNDQTNYFYWIDIKGIELLDKFGVKGVCKPILTLKALLHGVAVTQALLHEAESGFTALTSSFHNKVKPDLYIERGEGVYFVEIIDDRSTYSKIKEKLVMYIEDDYVKAVQPYLHIYYTEEPQAKVIKQVIRRVRLTPIDSDIKLVRLFYIDMAKVVKSTRFIKMYKK